MRARSTTPPVHRRSPLPFGIAAALVVILASATPRAAQEAHAQHDSTARQGLRIRFAAIDGQAGVDGNAFLLFSSRRISLDAPPASSCRTAHVVRAEARSSRGYIQKVELTLHMRGGSVELPIRDEGCPRAELRAELEDGTWLSGGEGTVSVDGAALSPGGRVSGTYSWTVRRGESPFPMRGEFNLTLP